MKKIITSLACLLLLASCFERPVNPGEIAFVNGTPITLKQLQAAHDALVLSGDSPSRATPALQNEYGNILAELIVQELVLQEMERLHIAISQEELAAEEALIRSDFPGDEFERMMLEESMDIDNWRKTLYRSLSMRKFWNKALRQQVTLTAQEVEEYYLEHQEAFQIPEIMHFIQISGLVREQITTAAEQFKQLPDAATIQGRFPSLTVREIHMHVDRLAPEQLAGLTGLRALESSAVMDLNGEFFTMILLGKEKARTMTRTETYAMIEGILLEEKSQVEFDKWVAARVGKSTIKVSAHLIPEALR